MRRYYVPVLVLALLFPACSFEGDAATSTTVSTSTVSTSTVTTSTVAAATTFTTVFSETVFIAALRSFSPEELWVEFNDTSIIAMADGLCRIAANIPEDAEAYDPPANRGQLLAEIIVDGSATDTVQLQWFMLMAALIDFRRCDDLSTEVLRETKAFLYEVLDG